MAIMVDLMASAISVSVVFQTRVFPDESLHRNGDRHYFGKF